MTDPDAVPVRGCPPAFHVMVKPRGSICNLGCRYCYYLAKARLYADGDAIQMSDEVLDSFTRQYLEAQQAPEATIGWQGGEPTLCGLPFFRRAVELQARYRRPEFRVTNTLQTNGTRLDDEWCGFLREHGFLVGLSLDGPARLHDVYRQDKAGQPTFEAALRGLRRLQQHGVEHNLLVCVHAANAGQPLEVYRFLRDQAGARYLQFLPIVERDNATGFQEGETLSDRSVAPEQYGRFLTEVFDEWVRRDVGTVFVQLFDVALAAWTGQRPGLCVFEEECGLALVLEHNGDLYACDHYVEPAHRRGNLLQTPLAELVGSEAQRQFGAAKRAALPRCCRECEVRFACHGECPKNRIRAPEPGEGSLNHLCAGYKAFFRHLDPAMRFMAGQLARQQAPAAVMSWMRELDRTTPRNAPCPCGSGRKYKSCHGRAG